MCPCSSVPVGVGLVVAVKRIKNNQRTTASYTYPYHAPEC